MAASQAVSTLEHVSPPSWSSVEIEDAEITRLRSRFEDSIGSLSQNRRYKHVAALLLYWGKVSESYIDTQQEVSEAARSTTVLNTSPGRAIEMRLRRSVSLQSLAAQPQPCRRQEESPATDFAKAFGRFRLRRGLGGISHDPLLWWSRQYWVRWAATTHWVGLYSPTAFRGADS
jgi:hypothetical protein